jgi:hypothetical protein
MEYKTMIRISSKNGIAKILPLPTVTLRVVGDNEKGSLKSETVKYCRESQGTQTRERLRWQGPTAYREHRPVLTSEREPHKNKTVTAKQ